MEVQAARASRNQSVVNLLADPTKVRSLSDLFDRALIQFCQLWSIASLIQRYKQDKAIFNPSDNSNNREGVLWDEVQHRGIHRLLTDIRSHIEEGNSVFRRANYDPRARLDAPFCTV